ncbi:MAG TPA: PAS domain-containing protein, partial [Acidobacteriota bacterium]|nr:PAS domain-containing protein [Acidobacteriota bacterium]
EVFVAQDGLEGLEINRQVRPQIIVLDVVLPKLDGFRFCRYLKEDPEFAEVPIIVLSSIGPEDMQRMIENGALTALPKEPMAQLLPKLSRIIESILTNQRIDQEKRVKERTPPPEILRELMKERSHFQEIMAVLPDGFIELDSMHRVLFANAAACRLLKQNEVSIVGKNFPEIFLPEMRLRLNTILRSVTVGNALPFRETIPFENQHLKLSFASVSASSVYTGAIVLIHDAGLEVTRMEELNRQNRQLQQMKQELERRFNAVQIIQRLSSEVQYPYGYPEIIGAILAFLPELMNTEITASLMQSADTCKLHIFVKEDVGQEAINRVKAAMLEHYQSISGQTIEAAQVLYSFSGVSFTNAASLPLRSTLFAPIKIEENVDGSIGCFSTQPAAFTYFDEQLLGMFLNLTLNAVVDLRILVESERKKMQAMVESMADGVLMTDQSDQLVVMNQAARKILHVSRKEDNLTKKYFQDTLGFYPFHLTKGMVQRSGLPATIKEEIKVFDKTLHSVVSPVYDQEGRQTGTVVVLRDITEQKEMEERKNDFLSVISHELRTPLASIGGSIDLVLEGV